MIVCSCFAVSSSDIQEVLERGADSVAAVGAACGAGTDCGSCCAQIREIIGFDRNRFTLRAAEHEDACARALGARRLVIRAA